MTGELFMHTPNGKPLFSDQYYEIEREFVDCEPITPIDGEPLQEEEVQELDPINDLGLL